MKRKSPRFLHFIGIALVCNCSLVAVVGAGPEPVTIKSPLIESSIAGGGDSENAIVTPDGRFVLFASTGNNLAAANSNTPFLSPSPIRMNVYLRNRTNGTTALVSLNRSGTGGANGDSLCTGLSTNGRFALFESSASDLVLGDTNNFTDVFVRDLVNGTNLLVSVSTNGGAGNRESQDSVMTPDGRYVAFVSSANNLVTNDNNGIADVFVRDLVAGTTVLVSTGAAKPFGFTPARSGFPEITPDGRYVVFFSSATNLVSGATNLSGIYSRDLVAGTMAGVSIGARAFMTNPIVSYNQVVSDDGRFVAFESIVASFLLPGTPAMIFRYDALNNTVEPVCSNPLIAWPPGDQPLDMSADGRFITYVGLTNLGPGTVTSAIFVWDGQMGTTTLVSADLNGAIKTNAECKLPIIDANGQFISFLSTATSLTTNVVVGGDFHLYVRDLANGTTKLVDVGTNGVGSAKNIWNVPGVTSNGRFIAFDCNDADLVAGDNNHACDVFLRDLLADTTELVSVRDPDLPNLTAAGSSGASTIGLLHSAFASFVGRPKGMPPIGVSDDGRYLAFASDASDLAAGDTNRVRDIFVRDLLLGTNILVSADTNGLVPAKGLSSLPAISAAGRYVAFCSAANSLVAGDTNGYQDVFVRDLMTSTTTLVSVSTNGINAGNGDSVLLSLSADGRFVLFTSLARNLTTNVLSSPFGAFNLFRRDLQLGTTIAITTGSGGYIPLVAFMSRDGQVVVFELPLSQSDYLYKWTPLSTTLINTGGSPSGSGILYALSSDGRRVAFNDRSYEDGNLKVRDLVVNTNVLVDVLTLTPGNLHRTPQLNFDGRFLVYATRRVYSAFDTNNLADIYVYDYDAGTNQLISRSVATGFVSGQLSDSPTISADGRFVAYRSFSGDIVSGITNTSGQIYLYDRTSDTTAVVGPSKIGSGAANSRALTPVFSGDSQNLIFKSLASDFLYFDFNQNPDLFSWRLWVTNVAQVFSGQMVYAPTSGKSPTLTWPVVDGKSYQVQFKNNLTDTFWQPLNGPVTILGDIGYATDLAPSPTQRFYRILSY